MNKSGFSLIELLVVVAIIGILAAVGIVAYSGYTESAKINTAKSNFKSILKYIEVEVASCDVAGGTIISGLKCSDLTSTKDKGMVLARHLFNGSLQTALPDFENFLEKDETKLKNRGKHMVPSGGGVKYEYGYVNISGSGKSVQFNFCFAEPCSNTDNQMQDFITLF